MLCSPTLHKPPSSQGNLVGSLAAIPSLPFPFPSLPQRPIKPSDQVPPNPHSHSTFHIPHSTNDNQSTGSIPYCVHHTVQYSTGWDAQHSTVHPPFSYRGLRVHDSHLRPHTNNPCNRTGQYGVPPRDSHGGRRQARQVRALLRTVCEINHYLQQPPPTNSVYYVSE